MVFFFLSINLHRTKTIAFVRSIGKFGLPFGVDAPFCPFHFRFVTIGVVRTYDGKKDSDAHAGH